MRGRERTNRQVERTGAPSSAPPVAVDEQSSASEHSGHAASAGHSLGRIQVTPAGSRVQRRARVGGVGDPLESEAERIATAVTGTKDPFPSGGDSGTHADESVPEGAERLGAGRELPEGLRRDFETRLGYDFGGVRVHTDGDAAQAALAMQARAFTLGPNIAFAPGAFEPERTDGRWLLAHELTHVAQQGAAPAARPASTRASSTASSLAPTQTSDVADGARVAGTHGATHDVTHAGSGVAQRGFFGDLWSGIQTVGRAIGGAIEAVGGAISTAVDWIAGRVQDAGRWVANLLRDLPARLMRFGEAIVTGLAGAITFIPEAIGALISGGVRGFGDWIWQKLRAGAVWVHRLVTSLFDLIGGPELFEFALHMFSKATPLTSDEVDAGKSVLGDNAIRWSDVRVGEGGILALIFALNGGRAFTTFHTINIPSTGDHARSNVAIMVHELTHVYQFERAGSRYLGEAIHAQATIGYGYGGSAGLTSDRAAGKHYRDYNREQQAQIAQDYYTLLQSAGDTTAYDPFIAELRAGEI